MNSVSSPALTDGKSLHSKSSPMLTDGKSSSMSTDGMSFVNENSKQEPVHLRGSEGLVIVYSRGSSI